MAANTGEIAGRIIALALVIGVAGFLVIRSIKRADDPVRMILKWFVTLGVVVCMVWVAFPALRKESYEAFYGFAVGLVCLAALIVTWRQDLAALVAAPLAALYDGGTEPPDPHPAYSVALARQKQGRYLEAVAEIRKQLSRFPTDVEGQLLLAQIEAEDLRDLPAAELTIQHFCEQPGHAPQNVVFALYSLADWHLKIAQDREAARRALETIMARYPDSEFAPGAAHRIAHLGSAGMPLPGQERKQFVVTEGAKNLGLLASLEHLRPTETDPAQVAAEYVKLLEQHPLDFEAREKLAVIYADHYRRLDLATEQLEQLIQEPHQPAKLVVHWLNLLADLQVRGGADHETIRQTLQRIVDLNPHFAAAQIAQHRLALLNLELKAREKGQAIKLGSYEQHIGLKQGRTGGRPPSDPAGH